VAAVFERSLALLAPREREALEALAVFRGSFNRAAAQAVAGTALPLLASLVDKSLLATTEAGRFVLHPLLAALAAQRLQARPTRLAQLQARHARHLLGRLAEVAAPSGATREVDALIDAEEADLRQAWQHALASHEADLVAPLLPVWAAFCDRRGRQGEGAALLRPALQWPAADSGADRVLGRARVAVAGLWFRAGEARERVRELAGEGIAPARRAGDSLTLIRCLATCAACDSDLGRLDAARAGFEEALALAEAHGEAAAAVNCLRNLAGVLLRAGDYEGALHGLRRAQQRAREAGLDHAELDALMAQAGPQLERADWAAAERVLRQAMPMAKALGARQLLLTGRGMLGCALIELGRLDEACAELNRARDEARALGQGAAEVYAQTYLALAAARAGRLDEAEAALLALEQQQRDAGRNLEAMRALLFRGEVLARRGDAAGAAAAWQTVADDPALPAGERDTARRWAAELAAGGAHPGSA
jgi:tetratricopeptide (TPR) repeat protein